MKTLGPMLLYPPMTEGAVEGVGRVVVVVVVEGWCSFLKLFNKQTPSSHEGGAVCDLTISE